MATIKTNPPTTAAFMGNPMIVKVTSDAAPSDAAFHRVMLLVTMTSPSQITFEPLSRPVSGTSAQDVEFDISSCFRAAADMYDFEPVTDEDVTYPVFNATVAVRDVWVKDGELCDPATATSDSKQFTAVMGEFSDYERFTAETTRTFSRKPNFGELACPGDTIVYAGLGTDSKPSSKVTIVSSDKVPGTSIKVGDKTFYVCDPQKNSKVFQFVNSRGCVESIRAWGSSTEKANTIKTETTRSIFERLATFSRTYLHKQLKPSEFQMSSGFVDYEWARWWAYEFCQAKQHWMLHNSQWIPVHITINDSLTIIDRTQVGMCSVEFTVKPDLNGPLW